VSTVSTETEDVVQCRLNTPWKPIIVVNYAMSSGLKYCNNVSLRNILLQDVGE